MAPEEEKEITLVLKIRGYGKDPVWAKDIIIHVGLAMHHTFGSDRYEIWHEGKHFVIDSIAYDSCTFGQDAVLTEI